MKKLFIITVLMILFVVALIRFADSIKAKRAQATPGKVSVFLAEDANKNEKGDDTK